MEVAHNGKTVFIRKSTAIWLFQECKHVSSDRLFRVRARQPHSSESEISLPKVKHMEIFPKKCETLNVGDICVCKKPQCEEWKVLQFFLSHRQN